MIITVSCVTAGQHTSTQTLKLYEFAELESQMVQEKRPVAIFLHAPWCQFCRNMEQTTFQDKNVVQLLNDKYFFISFNGEQEEEVVFQNKIFQFQPTGRNSGTHQLAEELGTINGELIYPAFVILNPEYQITFQYNAFLDTDKMIAVLKSGSDN